MTTFSEWLTLRFSYDAQARSRRVQALVQKHFRRARRLNVLDLGAGTGGNTRHYAPLLAPHQRWLLLERDPSLTDQCIAELTRWALGRGWRCRRRATTLRMKRARRVLSMTALTGDLDDIARLADLSKFDLVTANALFDLVSAAQFSRFAETIASHRLPLLTTLNYRRLAFSPADEADDQYISLYEKHMQRQQAFGRGLGAGCVNFLKNELPKLDYRVSASDSVWRLAGGKDAKLINNVLQFMHDAIGELLKDANERRRLEAWIEAKREMAAVGQLKLRIEHEDIFARFDHAPGATASRRSLLATKAIPPRR